MRHKGPVRHARAPRPAPLTTARASPAPLTTARASPAPLTTARALPAPLTTARADVTPPRGSVTHGPAYRPGYLALPGLLLE
jgi:hypothetical protein